MRKQKCKHERTHCYDSRKYETYRRRRYECLDCGKRFTTVETEISLPRGHKVSNADTVLRKKFGLSRRQQKAIGELIQAFLEPEDEQQN